MEYPTVGAVDSIGRNIETSDRKYLSSGEREQRDSLRHEIFCTIVVTVHDGSIVLLLTLFFNSLLPLKTEDWRFLGFLLVILGKTV